MAKKRSIWKINNCFIIDYSDYLLIKICLPAGRQAKEITVIKDLITVI